MLGRLFPKAGGEEGNQPWGSGCWGNLQELSQFFSTESGSIPCVTEWTMC